MFTRRVLLKMLLAVGGGALLPAVGESRATQLSDSGEAQSFSSALRARGSLANPGEQVIEVSAIERWEDLLDDIDGVELIGRHTSLQPTGDQSPSSQGPCPFCRHGTGSLLLNNRDDTYFCTKCLTDGHALDLYARMAGLSLPVAIKCVTGLLTSGQLEGKRVRKERLWGTIEEINRFAHEALLNRQEGKPALVWLDRQGITSQTVQDFSVGVMSYALSKQLMERLLTAGFKSDELKEAALDGWVSCMADRLCHGERDLAILLPVRNTAGQICAFYEQFLEDTDLMPVSHLSPYGFKLLSPHRTDRLTYGASTAPNSASSVVLVGRPWDVVLLTQVGLDDVVYVSPLDPDEPRGPLNKFVMSVRRVIWPIHSSELTVEFLRSLCRLSDESIRRLAFLMLPEGERLPELIRREGITVVQSRLAGAVPVKALLGE